MRIRRKKFRAPLTPEGYKIWLEMDLDNKTLILSLTVRQAKQLRDALDKELR